MVLLALLQGGCSKPEVRYARPDFDFAQLRTERIAVAGFVLGAGVPEDPTGSADGGGSQPATVRQSWQWTPLLEARLLAQAPQLDCWSFASVADQIEPERLDGPLRLHARGGVLQAAQLDPLAADLPGVRFLLLGRLDRDEQSLDGGGITTQNMDPNSTGLGQPDDAGRPVPLDRYNWYQKREITASLELYDLQNDVSVWSARVQVDDQRQVDQRNAPEKAQVRVQRDPEAAGGVRILGQGGFQGGPPLEGLLGEACGKLVAELLGWVETDAAPGNSP